MNLRHYLQVVVLLITTLGISDAKAIEIYALYGKDCQSTVGAIVHVNESNVVVLDVTGNLQTLPINKVKLISRYDILENPFPSIGGKPGDTALLEITSEASKTSFRAYATNFVDGLVLFLDETGKIRVVEFDEIITISRPPKTQPTAQSLTAKPISLLPPPGRSQCKAPQQASPRAATHVITDKLRIDSFWEQMRTGHRNLESLRERTLFYARPFLFDRKTRLGIVYEKSSRHDKLGIGETVDAKSIPLYLDFGGGSAYRFQSNISLGSKSWRMAPQIRPITGARSEFKSHLLHGMFLGNVNGLSAGSSIYDEAWSNETARSSIWFDSSFNHLTLLGLDYGPWSLSYGYYFPVFVLGKEAEFREILGRKASPVGRAAIQQADWQLELFVFTTSISDQNTTVNDASSGDRRDDGDLFVRYYSEQMAPLRARLNSTTVRMNFALFPVGAISGYSDIVLSQTQYREASFRFQTPNDETSTDSNTSPVGETISNRVDNRTYAARIGARMDVGKWVGLGAQVAFEQIETKGGFKINDNTSNDKASDQFLSYLAIMELLL